MINLLIFNLINTISKDIVFEENIDCAFNDLIIDILIESYYADFAGNTNVPTAKYSDILSKINPSQQIQHAVINSPTITSTVGAIKGRQLLGDVGAKMGEKIGNAISTNPTLNAATHAAIDNPSLSKLALIGIPVALGISAIGLYKYLTRPEQIKKSIIHLENKIRTYQSKKKNTDHLIKKLKILKAKLQIKNAENTYKSKRLAKKVI